MVFHVSRMGAVLTVAISAVLACGQIVRAADFRLPPPQTFTPPPVQEAPPPSAWNGCYAGAHGGLAFLKLDYSTQATPYGLPQQPSTANHSRDFTSMLVGAHIGCNYAVRGLVTGFEFEAWITPGPFDEDCKTLIDPILDCVKTKPRPTIAGSWRLGYGVDRFFVFGKAGLAWLNTDFDSSYHRTKPKGNTPTLAEPFQYNEQHTRAGLLSQMGVLLGVGVEYAITNTWSAKVEYDQILTSAKSFDSTIAPGGSICDNNSGSPTMPCYSNADIDTSGKKARQTAKLGQSLIKIGVSRKF